MSHFGGAGTIVHLDSDAASDPQNAYLVSPSLHIGRVVTGVVLLCEASPSQSTYPFPLAASAFADKLAEQGYKVLAVTATLTKNTADSTSTILSSVVRAAAFLRERQDIQRLALLGYGAGADIAIKIALEQETAQGTIDCFVALSPDGHVPWTAPSEPRSLPPMLLLVGGKTAFTQSEASQQLQDAYARNPPVESSATTFRSRVFPGQMKGFAFSAITDEDAATQAIAEILDWLVMHLHRFRVAAATSDIDPWWPQGRNGPFRNIGLQRWQETRNQWTTPTQTRPPRPPSVPSHVLFDGLSSMRRTFELPHRMALGDVVELFVEIWEVQQ